MQGSYDVIVVGGGHAGCEAAMAASRMGSSVLLISMDMNKFAQMSCNPAIGGIAKGQIVREIDALGGYTGIVTDASTPCIFISAREKIGIDKLRGDLYKMVAEIHAGRYPFDNFLW